MIKFADKVIEEIKLRKKDNKTENFVTGEEFEQWLRRKRTINQKSKKENPNKMPYIEIHYYEDNISCAYWQSGSHFYRKYEFDKKAKRVSEKEYMWAYEMYYDL